MRMNADDDDCGGNDDRQTHLNNLSRKTQTFETRLKVCHAIQTPTTKQRSGKRFTYDHRYISGSITLTIGNLRSATYDRQLTIGLLQPPPQQCSRGTRVENIERDFAD